LSWEAPRDQRDVDRAAPVGYKNPLSFSRFTLDSSKFLLSVASLVPMILSLTVHEWAHAWSANKLGDDTAERMGRLTLNPLAHIDILGTIILPLLGSPIGWAKPVPVDASRFRRSVNTTRGWAITAAAGPLANVALAVICAVILGLGARFDLLTPYRELQLLLGHMIFINAALAVFNLIPVPPLDGSRVIELFMPFKYRLAWDRVRQYAPFFLIGLVLLMQRGFLSAPFNAAEQLMGRLLDAIAGGA
jgi:Zn-dependent protease